MRNYTCRVKNTSLTIDLNKLEKKINDEKKIIGTASSIIYYQFFRRYIKEGPLDSIFHYLDINEMRISEINNNCERYPGLLVKFSRPMPGKKDKKLTLKILSSGKINFDGGNSELEINEMYYWLQYIFIKYWDTIMFDPTKPDSESETDSNMSDFSYDSIYDDDENIITELGYRD